MSIYKSPNSPFYQYDFWVGGRRFHGSTKAKVQKDAKLIEKQHKLQAKIDMEAEARTGQGPMTLDFAAGRYWQEVGQHHRDSAATFRNTDRLIEFFGKDMRLDAIGDAEVAALVAWRRAQRVSRPATKKKSKANAKPLPLIAPATTNRTVLEPLRKIMTRARKVWRVSLPREPNWREHRLKEPPGRVRELHDGEERALMGAVRSDFLPWIEFALLTGLRRAETLIKWENVNWGAGVITTTGKRGRLVTTPITPEIAELLGPLKDHHPEYVFTYTAMRTSKQADIVRGRRYPITYEGGKTEWQRLAKRAGLKDFRFHDLRHTMATRLLRDDGRLPLVQKALNHADISTTARYAHVAGSEVAEALHKMAGSRKKSRSGS